MNFRCASFLALFVIHIMLLPFFQLVESVKSIPWENVIDSEDVTSYFSKSLWKPKRISLLHLFTIAIYSGFEGSRREKKKKTKRLQMIQMDKHKSYTIRNNLLFVARTPQTWTTCILLFNFAWILYTILHEDTPPHHKTPRFRIFDDIWIVSCHSHSWLVLSSFYNRASIYERCARIRI